MLELFVTETDEGLERDLVAEPMVAADLEDLRVDETLDEAEQVDIGAALHLAEDRPLCISRSGS
jgi:hypothetical protein